MRKTMLCLLALGIMTACSSAKKVTTTVAVQADDYSFDPATITVQAGRVAFDVQNIGKEEHEFEIFRGAKLVDEVEDIAPGLTRSLTADLEAGTYTFVCKLPGHEEKGMKGTLTVT